jgi:hypothetical protein
MPIRNEDVFSFTWKSAAQPRERLWGRQAWKLALLAGPEGRRSKKARKSAYAHLRPPAPAYWRNFFLRVEPFVRFRPVSFGWRESFLRIGREKNQKDSKDKKAVPYRLISASSAFFRLLPPSSGGRGAGGRNCGLRNSKTEDTEPPCAASRRRSSKFTVQSSIGSVWLGLGKEFFMGGQRLGMEHRIGVGKVLTLQQTARKTFNIQHPTQNIQGKACRRVICGIKSQKRRKTA